MNSIFEILMKEVNKNSTILDYERNILRNIEKNELLLKKRLSKNEKKLLLRIIDNEGLLLEDTAIRNFTTGFKLGVMFGLELWKE